MSENGADRTVIGKLFKMPGAVELKARLANTVAVNIVIIIIIIIIIVPTFLLLSQF